jgi:hypothetical protein
MFEFTFNPSQKAPIIFGYPIDFRQAGIFGGNLGARLNQASNYFIESATYVEPKPEPKDVPSVGGMYEIAQKIKGLGGSVKSAMLEAQPVNPAGAELMLGQRPDGSFLPGYGLGNQSASPVEPEVMPMWAADP